MTTYNDPQGPQTGDLHVGPTDPENVQQRTPAQAAPATAPPTLACMKQVKRWLLWRYDTTKKNSKGKHPKIPYYTNGRKRGYKLQLCSQGDLYQLATYDEAVAALNAPPGKDGPYNGIGFATGRDEHGGYWQAIDLDGLDPEMLHETAKALPGYVEVTPSGRGLHAIGWGRAFSTIPNCETGIEAYSTGQYMTFTEQQLKDDPLTDLHDFVTGPLMVAHSDRLGVAVAAAPVGDRTQNARHDGVRENIDQQTKEHLLSALMSMKADDRHFWIKVGMALKTLVDGVGYELFATWSPNVTDPAKYDEHDVLIVWNSFDPHSTNWRWIFTVAQDRGWLNPNSNEAREIGGAASQGNIGSLMGNSTPSMGGGRVLQEQTMDSIVAQAIDWIWEGWIAKRYINIFAGETGAGKSTVLADIVSRITTGEPWPSDEEDESKQEPRRLPASVLWLGSEDGLEDMTKPRMMAAGADNTRIVVIKGVTVNGKRGTFSMQDDIETVRARLQRAVAEGKPFAMLVIDPITSYLSGSVLRKVDMNDSGHIRSILEPWMAVSQEFDIAICAVTHFTKDTTRSMLHRVLGSGAFAATCRSLVAVVKPPEGEDGETLFGIHAKVMIQTKTNLPDPPKGAWIFETERKEVGTDPNNGKTIAATRAVWQEVNEMITPASYLGAKRGPVSKKAMPFGIWLQTLFLTVPLGEMLPVQEVMNKALAARVITAAWWKDHSPDFLEKANINGVWMCKMRNK